MRNPGAGAKIKESGNVSKPSKDGLRGSGGVPSGRPALLLGNLCKAGMSGARIPGIINIDVQNSLPFDDLDDFDDSRI